MTSLVHSNDTDNVLICICCTSQSEVLVKYSACKHTGFLLNFFKSEIECKSMYICNICHNMLKKIEVFKQQVEESIALLLNQVPILKINKLHDLQRSPIKTNEVMEERRIEIEVKVEPEYMEVEPEVKFEHDSSDNDTEPAVEVKKMKKEKKKKMNIDSRYEGKIGVVMLTEEEVKEERERTAKNEGYLKLPYKCEDCIVGFDHEVSLVSHTEKKHRKMENGLQCNVCKTILNSKGPYTAHIKTHTRRVECLICHKRYNRMQSAVQHYDEQHATPGATLQQGYTCSECEYNTTSNRAYRYHMDKHKKKHICTICANIFANSQGLKTHMYTVHNQSPRIYKCEPCNKSYRSRTGFENHERTAHGTTDIRAFCVQCNTHYSTPQGLRNHLNTSSRHVTETDKRFICDECGAKFATKSALTVHINWEHIKSNTHKCTTCTKVFKSFSALNRHVNYVHNKMQAPRNKICDYCGRAFTTQQKLQNHIRTHTGERPLHCKHCPATFAHSAALYNHNKLLHTPK